MNLPIYFFHIKDYHDMIEICLFTIIQVIVYIVTLKISKGMLKEDLV